MTISITGPTRPPKALLDLHVDSNKASSYEGLFDENFYNAIKLSFNPSEGYHHPGNRIIYDTLWQKVFQSLTGEPLEQCLTQWLLKDEEYLPKIAELFGSIEAYKEEIGFHPLDVHGINLDGTWIISKDKKNLALLACEFHEIGHRVYPVSADRYNRELGANYFMFLAMKKVDTELKPGGLALPHIDWGEQLTSDHARALVNAKNMVDLNIRYIHQVSF